MQRPAAPVSMPPAVLTPAAEPRPSPAATSRRGWGFVARVVPFAVPLLYLAVVLWLQPSDHLGAPEWAEWAHQGVYDDHDVSAMALRALNDRLGRLPGFVERPELVPEAEYVEALDDNEPLKPRYYLEYPHAALAVFRLGYVFQPEPAAVPHGLLDGAYINIVRHLPRDEGEQVLWRQFRRATQIYASLMTACLLALVVVLRAGYGPERPGGAWLAATGALLLLPGALYFTLNRFDVLPALLTALALACLGRRWLVGSAFFLAAATLVKVYAVLLVPLVLRYLWPRRREARSWAAAYAATAVLFLAPPLLHGWESLWAPYHTQLSRDPELGSAYGIFLPVDLAYNDLPGKIFRNGVLLMAVALLAWRPVPDLASLLRRGALVLLVFVTVPVFWSPQWILWLAPLLLPLAVRQRGLVWLIVALDLVNYLTFMGLVFYSWQPPVFRQMTAFVRCLIVFGLAAMLLRAEWRGRFGVSGVRPTPAGVQP